MKNFCITYRIGPKVEGSKQLYVEAPNTREAVNKARRLLGLRYPHFVLMAVCPGIDFSSDSEEIYALTERLRAER